MTDRIQKVYRMDTYKAKLWERLLLPFYEMQTWHGEDTVLRFKSLLGRMYIYEIRTFARVRDNAKGIYN